MSGRDAVALVARREIVQRTRERSFQVSTLINVVIVVAFVIVAGVIGGGDDRYVVGHVDAHGAAVVEAAAGTGAEVESRRVDAAAARAGLEDGSLDAVVGDGRIRFQEDRDDELVTILQAANRQVSAAAALERAGITGEEARAVLDPRPLRVSSVEPAEDDGRSGLTFFIVLVLYGQILTYGYWVAAGVVEEKASRVVEVVLSTVRPAHLLAGKVIGLGLLGLGNLLLVGVVGLLAAQATGALDIDGEVLAAVALALAWFLVGYAFYACAFAVAGALVPRQEELQSTMTPLSLILLISLFLAFAVQGDPDGTLARVTAFIPTSAPITMPPRIVGGDASTLEVVASFLVTIGAAAVLIPLAGRIYSGGVLRTGSAIALRDAWRAARA